ncbi:hypothetical protein BDW59DRAFT_147457 [Aspergillus cavernicola]|uniref:Bromo domain-containing protein n=1 Tax=Aspergillus cavernicola TaxID=176166 RepID=A0ABR4I9W5_9EURO
MARGKRPIEEIANKSDSADSDYSDHPIRNSRPSKSKSKNKNKNRPSKKKPRHDSEDDILDEDEDISDDVSSPASEEEEDLNAPRTARGVVARRAAANRPVYNEGDSSSLENDEEADEMPSPTKKQKSTVVKLRVGKHAFSNNLTGPRRMTRRTRDPSEDIYALTNSGRHIETITRGTRSPEVERGRRSSRGSKRIPEADETDTKMEDLEVVDETLPEIKASQLEISESEAPNSFQEGGTQGAGADEDGFVPESENGETKDDDDDDDDDDDEGPITRRRSRPNRSQNTEEDITQPEEEDSHLRRSSRKKPKSSQRQNEEGSDFEPEDGESNDEDEMSQTGKSQASPRKPNQAVDEDYESSNGRRAGLRKRVSRSRGQSETVDIAEELAEELHDLRGGRPRRRVREEIVYEKPRRSRKDVDYRIIRPDLVLPIEEAENEVNESPSRRGRGGGGGTWQRTLFPTHGPFGGGGPSAILGFPGAPAATGGVDSDSSDDEGINHPKGSISGPAGGPLSLPGVLQTHSADAAQGHSGTPANLSRVKDKQALADADPLGVDMSVDFNSVGGLQGHIDQLKEMVSLPLLYPEIFQRFHIVPPRGVLFHGPPGTGKTLLARALANSVSSEGRKVTFYMRKGADALSKWVGEAERQLRLLFEEARKTQPSIIFFDEIDGLAPVRSSKQEQIHASIVSTLLALMDGMDGRGQVIVIGATNRPDSIDPALRRPGRFDREFYFPLPNNDGRRAILDIHTKGWDPPLPGAIKDELAEITKGYGGADLRALCTEAALNAVQRRYPQIYKSDKKLLIDPKTIEVRPKDFMLAVKKMVPSSERSTTSGASQLPKPIEPLLRQPLVELKSILSEILPQRKSLTALEEAQFEEPEGSSRGFQREQMQQEFERSRVFRPRLLLRGSLGMGQQYLAGALLHHFEGLHVQSFDLPTLLSDSTRSPEAAVIQLFAEVKRHKPSVIYIPSLQSWFETVGQAVLSTFLGLLRSVPATDPVLLLGVMEASSEDMDAGLVRNLFGYSKRNIFELPAPNHEARREYFAKVTEFIRASPTHLPDPDNRKKRQLEELEVAPPPSPKDKTAQSKEQLKAQKKKDYQTLNLLKIRIQPIMDQIKKYKRFRTGVIDESQIRYLWEEEDPNVVTSDLPIEQRTTFRPFEKAYDKHGVPGLREAVSNKFFYNMEIVTIEKRLSNGYYKRPKDFLADIKRLAKDARQLNDQERLLRANELLSNVEVDVATIEAAEPALVTECENVYLRELEREKIALEKAKKAQEAEESYRANLVPHGNTESDPSSGPVVLGASFPDSGPQVPGRPVTPPPRSTVSIMTNGYHGGGGSDLNELNQSNGSHESHPDGDGDTYMTNSDHSAGKDTQTSSFGPSAQPKPAYSMTAPSQQVRRESGLSSFSQKGPMTPMAPGSQPGDYTNEASTTQTTSDKKSSEQSSVPQPYTQSPIVIHGARHDYPDLTSYPDRVSQEEHLPDTQQGDSSQLSPRPRDYLPVYADVAGASQSQPKSQPPVPLFDASSRQPTGLQSLLNDEDESPTLIIDVDYVRDLHKEMTQRTSGCSVEQLEQINTALMDYLWHSRGEWNRSKVAAGIQHTFNDVLEDMQAVQEIGPISQKTKEQLGSLYHM